MGGKRAHELTPEEWRAYAEKKLGQIRSYRNMIHRDDLKFGGAPGIGDPLAREPWNFQQRAIEAANRGRGRSPARRGAGAARLAAGLRYDLESTPGE